jgi:hypothetical protein
MRWRIAIAATAVLFVLSSASLIAQGKGQGGSKAPKAQAPAAKPTQGPKAATSAATKGPKTPTGVKPTASAAGATKPKVNPSATAPKGKSTVAGAKTTKTTTTATAAKTTRSPKATTTAKNATPAKDTTTGKGKTTKAAAPTATATSNAPTTDSPSTDSPTTTLTPAQQKLQKNTNLANKLRSRLPAGTDLMEAAAGFRNLGQFVAAVNVSNNLGIPFADLRMKMVDEHLSLGQSIQALKPTASGTVEARRAEYDAQGLIYQSEQEAQTSAASSKKKPKSHGSGGGDE